MQIQPASYVPVTWEQVKNRECPHCSEEAQPGEEWVGHEHGGIFHPLHQSCAEELFKKHRFTCITCKAALDQTSFWERYEKLGLYLVKEGEEMIRIMAETRSILVQIALAPLEMLATDIGYILILSRFE